MQRLAIPNLPCVTRESAIACLCFGKDLKRGECVGTFEKGEAQVCPGCWPGAAGGRLIMRSRVSYVVVREAYFLFSDWS